MSANQEGVKVVAEAGGDHEPKNPVRGKNVHVTSVSVQGKDFIIRSKISKRGVKFPFTDEDDKTWHNRFLITVTRIEGNNPIAVARFPFYGSHKDFEEDVTTLSDEDMKFAFRAFLEDANFGAMEFKDFCAELCYNEDSYRARRIYSLCKKSLEKARNLGFSDDEIIDALNELSEKGVE
jgi:hypothetical protein